MVAVLLVVFSVCFLSSASAVRGQTVYGGIVGTVTDTQGAAVAGAKVTVTSTTKGTTQETTTNESGNYTVTHLIPDTYSVRIEAGGFKKYEVASVEVSADENPKVDAQMTVGDVTQTVEVTGEVPQLKTESSDVAVEFNSKYVEDLPLLNRNFTNLELLSPGTQKIVGWSHAATENPQGSQQIFVDGQHFSGTSFILDGTDNQDAILGIIVVNPNLDAIEETKIALQNYNAEFGKAVAGVITVQTKSGTNELHGTGFYDYRGSGQQARDPFTQTAAAGLPNATYKDFGISAGAPIIKDKLFIFGDYQGVRQISGLSDQATIPSAEVLSTCNPATNAASDTPGYCNLSQYVGVTGGGLIYNPTTGNSISSTTPNALGRTQFCGPAGCATEPNWIPIGMISSQAAAILANYPAPTTTGLSNNFVGSGSGNFNQNAFDVRVDYAAPHGFQVFGRYSQDYFNIMGGPSLGKLDGEGFGQGGLDGKSRVHNYSLAAGFDKALSASWLTDVRFGYFKYNPQDEYLDQASTPAETLFGIPGLNLGTLQTGGEPSIFFNLNGTNFGNTGNGNNGVTQIGDGLNVGRCNCPLTESEQQFQVVNNWTKIIGNHSIKFGADIRYAENLRVPSDNNRTGLLNFDSYTTSQGGTGGLSLASFLLGDVASFNRFVSTSVTAAERQKRLFFYGQDTWRVTPKLTFNYGLRWEGYTPETVNGKGNGGFANLVDGVINVAGYDGVGLNGNVRDDNKAFAPRLGVAYQYDPKTVVRIGYGRSFDLGVFGSNFGHVVTQNLPVLANQTVALSNINPMALNNAYPVFTLTQGPPAFDFATVLGQISSTGTLPLLGPDGTSSSRIRPTIQRLPTVDAWNATVQRQVTPTISVEIAYVGNKGTHVFNPGGPSYNPNEPAVGDGTNLITCSGTPVVCSANNWDPALPANERRNFFRNGVPAFTYPGYSTPSGAPLTCCSSDLTYFGNDSSSNYNSLQMKVEKRFANGLQFLAHYTFSHSNAFDSGYYSVDPKYSYGPDQYNRDHVFVLNSVYELPFGRGKRFLGDAGRALDYLVGGWQVTNTFNWSSGLPWTASIGECGEITGGVGPCRPNINGSFQVGPRKVDGYEVEYVPVAPLQYNLTPADNGVDSCTLARPVSGPFSLPACGTIGNGGFDTFTGPRTFFSDLSLTKNFRITERINAKFRFDAYNVFNHVNFGFNSNQGNTCIDCAGPTTTGGAQNAGQITDIEADGSPGSPTGMRQLQFGLRVTF
jgi:hypothetical protein